MKLTITIPDELYQRLLSLQVDPERACLTALEAVVRGRMSTENEGQKLLGRPPKATGRKQVTLQVESDLLAKLDDLATARGVSRSDIVNLVIRQGITDVN